MDAMPEILIKSKDEEFICQFDQQDTELLILFRWSMHSQGYAVTTINGKSVLMHRLIFGVKNSSLQVDHRNHDKLDNRRSNLRICTASENRRNSRKITLGTSTLKGVYKDRNKWHVQIMEGGKLTNKGRFRSEITAGKVYDSLARLLYKDFAFLNFPDHEEPEQLKISFL